MNKGRGTVTISVQEYRNMLNEATLGRTLKWHTDHIKYLIQMIIESGNDTLERIIELEGFMRENGDESQGA